MLFVFCQSTSACITALWFYVHMLHFPVCYVMCLLQDYEKLSSFVQKHYNTTLTKKDLSVRGWNWGLANFVGKVAMSLTFC